MLNIDANTTMELIVDAAMGVGVPTEGKDYSFLKKNRPDFPMVIIAAISRSGATFLSNVLAKISKLNWMRLSSSYFGTENDLYLPALCIADRERTISLLHIRATYPSCTWINLFGIKTIISVRNIFDIIVSLAINVRNSPSHPNFDEGYSSGSIAWIDSNQEQLSDDKLLDMIIELYIPWIIYFYVSWYSVSKRKEVNALWITYEELKSDPIATIKKILSFHELDSFCDDWGAVINAFPPKAQEGLRTNSNSKPREYWQEKLTSSRIENIKNFASYYPSVDFSMIGI